MMSDLKFDDDRLVMHVEEPLDLDQLIHFGKLALRQGFELSDEVEILRGSAYNPPMLRVVRR